MFSKNRVVVWVKFKIFALLWYIFNLEPVQIYSEKHKKPNRTFFLSGLF